MAFGRVEAAAASINDKIAVADAQQAAFKAVTRDETGKLNVTFMPGGTLFSYFLFYTFLFPLVLF